MATNGTSRKALTHAQGFFVVLEMAMALVLMIRLQCGLVDDPGRSLAELSGWKEPSDHAADR
jgi:hypothetical protein